MSAQAGGAALTALPIVETEAEDLSAYIPTNLISITDGQVYLSPRLFRLGTLPAVDVGMSVSRVGGKAQVVALRDVAKAMRLAYAQFQELEGFARLGARLDPATQAVLDRGRRVRELLKQNQYHTLSGAEQVLLNLALAEGLFDVVSLDQMASKEAQLVAAWRAAQQPLDTSQPLSEEMRRKLLEMARAALADPHAQ
jgi:F-type H+-transporting ATPase subunit alpha